MNIKLVLNMLGKIFTLEALFMILPLIVALYYRESYLNIFSILFVIGILLVLGLAANFIDNRDMVFGVKEGFAVVTFSWLGMSFFGGLPFVINGQIPSLIDAVFEMASGFTTTGASILTDVESLSQSMLFWRSFSHFIGGMGILVFALAVLPKDVRGTVNVMKAEVPGPSFGKLVSKLDITAKILYKIYVAMTLVLILVLIIAGMSPFDSMIHAFGAAGTGGFSNKAASVGYYNSALIDYILGIGMIVFGINFNLYYMILIGRVRDVFHSEELKVYLFIIIGAVALICFNLRDLYGSFSELLRHVFFTVSSIITTTGYATVDFDLWHPFSRTILLMLMFIGSCAGSTAGGLKVSRIVILVKSAINEVRKAIQPRRVFLITETEKKLPGNIIRSTQNYFFIYMLVFATFLLAVSFDANNFLTAFSSVAATLNNIGPGMSAVGPTGNFAFYRPFVKIMLTIAMIVGRLEIIPILVLFMPSTWKKRT
ncbi:MAG: TrkH family potassium uptake protein [Gallicola sp.]|nr:TrkH family potassium uptake protein [Gallicola sp.]